jgi:hypothetical protein
MDSDMTLVYILYMAVGAIVSVVVNMSLRIRRLEMAVEHLRRGTTPGVRPV